MKKLFSFTVITLALIFGTVACSKNVQNRSEDKTNISNIKRKSEYPISIRVNGQTIKAHLNNSSAARQFRNELPMTLSFRTFMSDYPEKIADLHHGLSTKGMPKGHAGTKGSIGYWSPDQRIVFYYGTESYYEGIHIIGKFDSMKSLKTIRNMKENTKVRITRN